MSELQGIVTFLYGETMYGLPLSCVAEVLGHCSVNELPGLPEHISGMINLRGTIIAAVNIGPLLGKKCGTNPGAIVVKHTLRSTVNQSSETEDRNVAILIDEVGDILTEKEWTRHPVPANVPPKVHALLDGIINRNNVTINLLNLDELLRECTDYKDTEL